MTSTTALQLPSIDSTSGSLGPTASELAAAFSRRRCARWRRRPFCVSRVAPTSGLSDRWKAMSAPAMRVAERVVETRAFEISSCSDLKDSMTCSLFVHASVGKFVALYSTTSLLTQAMLDCKGCACRNFCYKAPQKFKVLARQSIRAAAKRDLHSPPVGPSVLHIHHHVCIFSARV
jgi:hypothetical protein